MTALNHAGAVDLKSATLALLKYCQENDWAGYDPYDALNSRIYLALPFLHFRWPRLVLTQALKRSPINIRSLLAIPKTHNAKAMGLFAEALLKLNRMGLVAEGELISNLADKIMALRSPAVPFFAWGYSFPWQTRTIVVPRGAPNLVCTTFVASSLVSLYEATNRAEFLDAAISAGNYIARDLFWTEGDIASFSYPMRYEKSRIHNANLLAAALLCRLHKHAPNEHLVDIAFQAARYSASRQREDGSWAYGELPTQGWIDNFHTGYNLCALRDIGLYADTAEFQEVLKRGYAFYVQNFIAEDGAAKYFHDRVFPIDVHSVAQTIITLAELQSYHPRSHKLVQQVCHWAIRHMRDPEGYFYYRVLPFYKIKTPFMRWGQAWMLLALSTLIERDAAEAHLGAGHSDASLELSIG